METAQLAPTNVTLLRPDQIEDMEGEREALEAKLTNPHTQDKGAVREQLKRLSVQMERQRPQPYVGEQLDLATKRVAELRSKIGDGMLSHEEMRKCPPGAIDRHRNWEKRNKTLIAEYQNIMRRLSVDSGDHEAASIETFRPRASTMNMDNSLVSTPTMFLPPPGSGPAVTFGDEEIALLHKYAPDTALKLALLSNERRAEVKQILKAFQEEEKAA